jgi:hypothetical protein
MPAPFASTIFDCIKQGCQAGVLSGNVFGLKCVESLFGRLQMPRTSGSGNASWQAVALKYRFKRGRPGFHKCAAVKRNGEPCGNLAMRGISVCQCHGGRMLTARLRFQRKAHRHLFNFSKF